MGKQARGADADLFLLKNADKTIDIPYFFCNALGEPCGGFWESFVFEPSNGEDLLILILGGGMFVIVLLMMIFSPAPRRARHYAGGMYLPYTYSSVPSARIHNPYEPETTPASGTVTTWSGQAQVDSTPRPNQRLEFTDLSAEGIKGIPIKLKPLEQTPEEAAS